ncbi:hypothetical protein DXG03_008099 [Asterophora parasitica]|uniref:Uncharacterized protein n=1 Tax=Asterophora parasitica TaxID=117018 RepID=A0A9P7KAH6_9AGAR|nr:hypothetical protein DXG03_008099 [Asterophora parasitica]
MSRLTTTQIALPVGANPGWELEGKEEEEERKNISESCVLIHALRQSRDRWLYSTFPKFSSKARAKAGDQAPPPHTIQTRGKCDLEIGPHVFPDTTIYEVHYLSSQTQPATGYSYQPSAGSWQSKTPYGSYAPPAPPANKLKPFDLEKSSTPLISSLTAVTTITPTLINQVNSAASSNPTLANLLQLAAAGMATPDQLKTLGILIQSLATAENTQGLPPALAATPALPPLPTAPSAPVVPPPPAPIKEFDLVLEFRESPSERWIFPRGLLTCERTRGCPATGVTTDIVIVIKACLPFTQTNTPENPDTEQSPVGKNEVVTFCIQRTSAAVWDTVSRWAGNEEKMEQNRLKLEALNPAEHVYLGYQLSSGPLFSQLQIASGPTYTMKALKAGAAAAPRAKRKAPAKAKADSSTSQVRDPAATSEATPAPPAPKRRRVLQPERPPAAPIQCVSCKDKDVPLILGGRE